MKNLIFVLGLTVALSGCARQDAKDALEIPAGSEVTVQKKDGVNVQGKLVEARAQEVVLESRDGVQRTVPRSEIAAIKATALVAEDTKKEPPPPAPVPPTPPAAPEPDDKVSDQKNKNATPPQSIAPPGAAPIWN